MLQTLRDKLDYIVRTTGLSESEIVARAVEEGISDIYRKHIADSYISGQISKGKAIDELGEDFVNELDYAIQSIEKDIKWGLDGA